ncbi:hypothetical protein V8B97DRAFT_1919321 [Scleroderma yunnanense]
MAKFTSASSTLGHHNQGPLEIEEWSTLMKCQLIDFAQGVCADLGVPVEQCDMIIEKSQEMLIIVMAMMARNDTMQQELAMCNYISSSGFKENVSGKLKVMLLNPRISNYKDALLQQALCHIHLNPKTYKIPLDVQQAVSSCLFPAEVSRALVYHRNQI